MPRVLFPNIPMRMVLQPRNKLAQNLRGAGALADPTDPRREGAWSKVVVHAPPSTNKFEIEQYLSKIYNVDVKKVNTLNVEGRTVQRINGRKMYKAKKFPDYKKAYVKVGPSPANVDSNEVDSEEWQGFMVPVRTSGGVGAQAMPRVEKYKMNQQTHWLNRLPLAEAEDEDEEGKRYDEVVAVRGRKKSRGKSGKGKTGRRHT